MTGKISQNSSRQKQTPLPAAASGLCLQLAPCFSSCVKLLFALRDRQPARWLFSVHSLQVHSPQGRNAAPPRDHRARTPWNLVESCGTVFRKRAAQCGKVAQRRKDSRVFSASEHLPLCFGHVYISPPW